MPPHVLSYCLAGQTVRETLGLDLEDVRNVRMPRDWPQSRSQERILEAYRPKN